MAYLDETGLAYFWSKIKNKFLAKNNVVNNLTTTDEGYALDARQGPVLLNKISSGGGVTLDQVYPVGSIYMSVNDVDPATLFGGTWTKIVGKFLLGADEENGYTLGSTGGEAKHKLSIDEMPKHNHTVNTYHSHDIPNHSHTVPQTSIQGISQSSAEAKGYGLYPGASGFVDRPIIQRVGTDNTAYLPATNTSRVTGAETYWSGSINTSSSQTGGSTAHNNMPPYLAVNIWQRTA